jgi:tetratricopeptide (TPR) repeat protein
MFVVLVYNSWYSCYERMYNIIPLILICASLFIIIVVIVRKFPALANLDVENMPAEKEARFKEQIITGRLQKNMAKWKAGWGKFFGFFGGKFGEFFQLIQGKLQEAKKNYSAHPAALPAEDKETMIKALLAKNAELDDRENFEEKEANLIKIIELSPRHADAFMILGGLYAANKKYEEGKQAFVHVLKLMGGEEGDKQAEIYYDLAAIYRDTGEFADSLETVKMAVKLAPSNPRYLDAFVEISIMNKDKISASEALEKLSEANPENGKLAEFREQIAELE